jgi:hypothetical protein
MPARGLMGFLVSEDVGRVGPNSAPSVWPFDDDVDVVLSGPATLDRTTTVNSLDQNGFDLTITPGVTLRSRGNIINDARIICDASASPELNTVIEFIGIDESTMKGSGFGRGGVADERGIMATDIGLWTVEAGTLELTGATKLAWTNSAAGIVAGQSVITAAESITGWRVGDTVVITPTKRGELVGHRTTITEIISSTSFRLAAPTTTDHPTVDVWGTTHYPELLNLSRNIKIRGTSAGRSHTIFLHCTQPQTLSYVEFSKMGPVGPDDGTDPHDNLPLGRWAVHFHHGMDDVRGSSLTGCTAYDVGSYAFVPHKAHGVTFTDCIAHEVGIGGFWWDDEMAVAEAIGYTGNMAALAGDDTEDAIWDHCVASQIRATRAWDGSTMDSQNKFGFSLGKAPLEILTPSEVTDCVAVGVQGDYRFENGGFSWKSTHSGRWTTDGSLAHNCIKGIDLWANNEAYPIAHSGMTEYNCQRPMRDGAYRTVWEWEDITIQNNYLQSVAGKNLIDVASTPTIAARPDLRGIWIDAGGFHQYPFLAADHHQDFFASNRPLIVSIGPSDTRDSHFKGGTVACIGFNNGDNVPHKYEVLEGTVLDGNEFWFQNDCPGGSILYWEEDADTTWEIRPATWTGDTTGYTFVSAWNAWKKEIPSIPAIPNGP